MTVTTDASVYAKWLTRSHTVTARVLASVNGSAFVLDVPLVRGSSSVSVSRGTGVARTLRARVHAELDDGLVDPYVAEWRVEYGIVTPRETLWVPVGVFVPIDVKQASRGALDVTAHDRWLRVADARFERSRVTSGDTVAAIVSLLTDADSRIIVDTSAAPTGETHRASVWERDRDKAVAKLARSIGAQVRFDAEGVARVTRAPSLGDPVSYAIGRGRGGAKIASVESITSRRTYNAVVVVGESPGGDPIISVARDSSTTSRTRYGGGAGKRPRFYGSDLIRTQAQADAVAANLLTASLRATRTLSVDALPHPGLDAGHVISAETRPGVWRRVLVDSYELPLHPGRVTIDTAGGGDDDDESE